MKITGLHWLKISQRYYERRAVNDRMQVQGGKASTEHVRGKPDFHRQVQDEPQGQVFADIALGGRLSLVPQGGCTLRAQCPRE